MLYFVNEINNHITKWRFTTKNKQGNKPILCDQMTTEKSLFSAFWENLSSSHKKLLKWFFLFTFLSYFSIEEEKLLADI